MRRVNRCNDMASLGFSRKRSHDDVDDGDECLPISKRINSLHIEGQSTTGLQASALTENNQDGFPCMNSNCPELCSDIAHPGSSELYASGLQQAGHSSLSRLPRIDEHMFQGVQTFQEREFGSRMDQENLHSFNHQNYFHQASCSVFSPNNSEQFPTEGTNHQSFSVHNSASNLPTLHRPHFLLPQSHQRTAHHDQSGHHVSSNHLDMGRHQQHLSFPTHEQEQSEAVDSMDSQQDFTCSHVVDNNSQQQLHHFDTERSSTNNVSSQENNMNSNSGLSFEEAAIENRSDFQREQLPSGNYEPELGMTENPFYFSVNQLLYEAHVSKVRRMNHFPDGS